MLHLARARVGGPSCFRARVMASKATPQLPRVPAQEVLRIIGGPKATEHTLRSIAEWLDDVDAPRGTAPSRGVRRKLENELNVLHALMERSAEITLLMKVPSREAISPAAMKKMASRSLTALAGSVVLMVGGAYILYRSISRLFSSTDDKVPVEDVESNNIKDAPQYAGMTSVQILEAKRMARKAFEEAKK